MNKRTLIFIGVLALVGLAWAGANRMLPGGSTWQIGNGGLLSVISGGELDVTSGTIDANSATVDLDGCTTTIDGGTTTFGATEAVTITAVPTFSAAVICTTDATADTFRIEGLTTGTVLLAVPLDSTTYCRTKCWEDTAALYPATAGSTAWGLVPIKH